VSTGNGAATDTMTTVSGASDVITPAWGYSQSLTATLNLASSLAERVFAVQVSGWFAWSSVFSA
jgi:hypothetical protein